MNKKPSYFTDVLPTSIFVGGMIGFGSSIAYHFMTQNSIYNKIDFLMQSLIHPTVLIIASVYVVWDGFQYLSEITGWSNDTSGKTSNNNGELKIEGLDKRLELLPTRIDLSSNKKDGEKVYDKLDKDKSDIKKGYAVFDNRLDIIDFNKYTSKDNTIKIKNLLGIPENNFFRIKVNSHRSVIIRWVDTLTGFYRFKPELMKKGMMLRGYTTDEYNTTRKEGKSKEEKEGYYYTDLDNGTHEVAVAGTGSGKSVMINSKLSSVFFNHELYEKIILIDLKGGMELLKYDGLFGGKVKVGKSIEEFCTIIEELYAELLLREEECATLGIETSAELQWYFLCDEFGQWNITLENESKGDIEYRQYLMKIQGYLTKIMTKSRAVRCFANFITQSAKVDHLPQVVRENCITSYVGKIKGFYDAIIPVEQMQSYGYDPENFTIGTFLFRDGTETHKKGDNYIYLKAVYTTVSDIIFLLDLEDKQKMVSVMWGQKIFFEFTGNHKNNGKVKAIYENILEFFNNKEQHKYIIDELVNDYLDRVNTLYSRRGKELIPDKLFMGVRIIEENYDNEVIEIYNKMIEHYEKVKSQCSEGINIEVKKTTNYINAMDKFTRYDLDNITKLYDQVILIKELKEQPKFVQSTVKIGESSGFDLEKMKSLQKEKMQETFTKPSDYSPEIASEIKSMINQLDKIDNEEDLQIFEEEVKELIDLTKEPICPITIELTDEEESNKLDMKTKLEQYMKEFPQHKDEINSLYIMIDTVKSLRLFNEKFNELTDKIYDI